MGQESLRKFCSLFIFICLLFFPLRADYSWGIGESARIVFFFFFKYRIIIKKIRIDPVEKFHTILNGRKSAGESRVLVKKSLGQAYANSMCI